MGTGNTQIEEKIPFQNHHVQAPLIQPTGCQSCIPSQSDASHLTSVWQKLTSVRWHERDINLISKWHIYIVHLAWTWHQKYNNLIILSDLQIHRFRPHTWKLFDVNRGQMFEVKVARIWLWLVGWEVEICKSDPWNVLACRHRSSAGYLKKGAGADPMTPS